MRLAVVSAPASPVGADGKIPDSGPPRRLAELAQALAVGGHEVRVYARADGRDRPDADQLAPGVVVEHVPAGPARPMSETVLLRHARLFGNRLAERWTRTGWAPDLVHAHSWLSGLAAEAATRLAPAPIVLSFHGIDAVRDRHLGPAAGVRSRRAELERELGRTVDRVITQSRAELSELARLGMPRRQMITIPIGVDPDSFTPASPLAARGPSRPRIVAVGAAGQLAERKGFVDLIRALQRVPDAEIVVIGGPARAELARDPVVRRLRHLARRYGVSGRVRFVGQIPRPEMPRWYRSADLVACAAWYEPFGVSALEAMASGVPVVASAVGGLRDAVVDGVTGVLVPPHHPAALGRAIRSVLADPIRRLEYAAAGLDRARQCYGWDRVAVRLTAQYRSLTG